MRKYFLLAVALLGSAISFQSFAHSPKDETIGDGKHLPANAEVVSMNF